MQRELSVSLARAPLLPKRIECGSERGIPVRAELPISSCMALSEIGIAHDPVMPGACSSTL